MIFYSIFKYVSEVSIKKKKILINNFKKYIIKKILINSYVRKFNYI